MERSNKINLLNIVLFLLVCILMWVRSTNSPLLNVICQEDGPIENTQAVLYFLAGLGFILIYVRNLRNLWYLALSLLLFALAGEEISWGQRIFDIAAPAWEMKHNVQAETNIHNIGGIHQHIRMVASIFIIAYFILVPILSRYFGRFREFFNKIKLPIYPIWGVMVLIIALVIMTFARVAFHVKDFQIDEIGELYIATGMFFFFLSEYWLTSTGKSKTLSTYVYIVSPICILLGIYFGLLHTTWPS